jgi:transcriptional regulator with XRE-family HTH domain
VFLLTVRGAAPRGGAGLLPFNSNGLPIICRYGAGGAGYGGVMLLGEPKVREVIGSGRRQIDGGKVVKLRKQLEMKQEDLAERARISVRHLREIERTNKSVPRTTVTAIANVLKVLPDEITLPSSGYHPSGRSLLPERHSRRIFRPGREISFWTPIGCALGPTS